MGLIYEAPFFTAKVAITAAAMAYTYLQLQWLRSFWQKTALVNGVVVRFKFLPQKGGPGYTTMSADLPCKGGFEFNRETWLDRWFKKRQLSTEIEVGNRDFDEAVYIESDSPTFGAMLRSDAGARDAIRAALNFDAAPVRILEPGKSILLEAGVLNLRVRGDQSANQSVFEGFVQLQKVLTALCSRLDFSDDVYAAKAAVARSVLAGVTTFGFVSASEMAFNQGAIFVNGGSFFKASLIASLILLCSLVIFVFSILERSSRLPRILASYAFVTLFTSVPAGIGLFADIDRYMDWHSEVVVERVVRDLNQVERHSSKGPRYNYFACFDRAELAGRSGPGAALELPDCIQLTSRKFYELHAGQGVRFRVGQGALGYQWYKQIQPLEM